MCQNHSTVLNFWASRNSEPDLADLAGPPETQHAVQNRPWVPHARRQDDGSLHKLLQISPNRARGGPAGAALNPLVFFEAYTDNEALKQHQSAAHYQSSWGTRLSCAFEPDDASE